MHRHATPALLLASAAVAQPCPLQPINTATSEGSATTSISFDDGSGPHTYIAGDFRRLGSVTDANLIRWTGADWVSVPGAPFITSLAVQTENGRQVLYTGGYASFARFDGASWNFLPAPPRDPAADTSYIFSLASFDPDGPGPLPPRIFASVLNEYSDLRIFYDRGYVWSFDGASWSPVGGLIWPGTLTVFDDGRGPRLYLAGARSNCVDLEPLYCSYVGGLSRLDGSDWTHLADATAPINAATVFDPGGPGPAGPLLCIGGDFTSLTINNAPFPAQRIAAYDGAVWTGLGAGIPGQGEILQLVPFSTPSSAPLLLATGSFRRSSGSPADTIAAWDGNSWSQFGGGLQPSGPQDFIRIFPFDSTDPALFANVGGILDQRAVPPFVTWRNGAWSPSLAGPGGPVLTLATFNEGHGPHLFAAGHFTNCGDLTVNNIARWDGSSWSSLGPGIQPAGSNSDPRILASVVHDDGSGQALYVAGSFQSAGGIPVSNIARWSGTTWQRVGTSGLSGGAVRALGSHDPDGAGPLPRLLYAGGEFTFADGSPAAHLAVWDGNRWSPVPGVSQSSGSIRAIRSFNESTGPALYVGGDSLSIAGLPANLAFRSSGGQWQSLPQLFPGGTHHVNAFAYHDAGLGPRIYAAGSFLDGTLARLDDGAWTLSYDIVPGSSTESFAARSVDDGSGAVLYSNSTRHVRLDSSPLFPNPYGDVRAISPVFDDGSGPSIFMAGDFSSLHGLSGSFFATPAANLARVPVCACYANCDGSTLLPVLNVNDFLCFQTRFASGDPYANCDNSTTPPILNVNDFLCFQLKFAAGCP